MWNTMREDVMHESGTLPPGWMWTTLGKTTDTTRMRTDPQNHPETRFIGMEHVEAHTMRLLGTIPATDMHSSAERFRSGDVLYGRLRPYLNKVFCPDFSGLCSGEFIIFRKVPHLESRYLQYFLNSAGFVSFASHLNAGDRPRVNFEQLADYPFPLPPLPEQRRIVAKIEELFTQLDAGIAALKRVQANLKRYRASVLKAACEGRLAPQEPADEPADRLLARILAERRAKWQAEHPGKKYVEPAAPVTDGLPELPAGGCWASLGQLAWDSGYGTSQKCDYEASGPPVLRIPNIAKGRIDLSDLKYATSPDELQVTEALQSGDLLIIRTNGSRDLIGRSAVVRETCPVPHYFASYLIRFRIISLEVLPVWISTVWDTGFLRSWIEGIAVTSAGQYNVSMSSLGKLPIPLPSLSEQHRIVGEAERRLSVVAELEATVAANVARAGRLRQAVLKRAFEGRLVAQEARDSAA